jgi:iron complex outermembrane receptor protein
VLDGQELTKNLDATIGATLSESPGVAMREFGNASGAAGDPWPRWRSHQRARGRPAHGRSVEPVGRSLSSHQSRGAPKIEVVRGPATLLYGANAIGGLVT